jgi:hypothetical protein
MRGRSAFLPVLVDDHDHDHDHVHVYVHVYVYVYVYVLGVSSPVSDEFTDAGPLLPDADR